MHGERGSTRASITVGVSCKWVNATGQMDDDEMWLVVWR